MFYWVGGVKVEQMKSGRIQLWDHPDKGVIPLQVNRMEYEDLGADGLEEEAERDRLKVI